MRCSAFNILFAAKLITELCTKGMNELPEESGRGGGRSGERGEYKQTKKRNRWDFAQAQSDRQQPQK